MTNHLPILYSFRRCPYAMRARLGLRYAKVKCELREVRLRDKPEEMIALSPKATVPVLHLPGGQVIDESYDIIKWAAEQHDPDGWANLSLPADALVRENDGAFKTALDKYKYAARHPQYPPEYYRSGGMVFLNKLERMLQNSSFLLGPDETMADIALFPFVRQFAHVDRGWFYDQPLPALQGWLRKYLDSEIFISVMEKYQPWHRGDEITYFS